MLIFCDCGGVKKRMADDVYEKSEPIRHQFEVDFVADHDGAWIKEYLDGVKEKRGDAAYKRLRSDVAKVWKCKADAK